MASRKRNGAPRDLSTKILIQIRDEIQKTNSRLSTTNERIDSTNDRLDTTNERLSRLERRQTEDAVRLSTELIGVAKAVGQVRDLLRDQRIDRDKMKDHERRISVLEKRSA